ncbi:cadherin-23-like [Musca vetustissima]|uniref:cadherin-23-like n=1 Tax=Musca vetustissima TaxID=27455 RepID=UPI002AB6697F|nr:cadherin-23-like [Musca vetustissima]
MVEASTQDVWQEPYFLNANTDGISWITANNSAASVQKISVREELSVPYILAKINYNGTEGTPTLGAFDIGDNSLLGARINITDNEWYITIEKRQDFENPLQRIYFFQVYIKDASDANSVEQSVFVTLENIFDNKPTVTYGPSPCRVEELHSDYLTECIFSIYDPDGMDRNNIHIAVEGDSSQTSTFAFVEFGETTTYEKQYKLKILKELHFDEKALYNLDVKVYDANNNSGDIFAILEVIDLPNRDPIWVKPLTTATFNEKSEQFFTLKAIDGDTGINKPICYRLQFEDDYSNIISINTSSGILHVKPIDRDVLNQQIFNFNTCAYKCDNASWTICNSTILIVQDINDHIPEIVLKPQTVQILEGKYLTLPLEQFYVEDVDLGTNASYNIYFINDNGSIQYSNAFAMIPNSGYQKTDFSLSVTQADKLDYENEDWRSFQLKLLAKEVENADHQNEFSLRIELINWNDEWPVFELDTYELELYENITMNTNIIQIQAIDRDVDDEVIHSLVGNIEGIDINPLTGWISINGSNVFDYERQSLMILQIQAKDTLNTSFEETLHTSYTQLQIKVLDVNDETPELRMPRLIINVTENAQPLTLITNKIEARDPDTMANLQFDIIWSASYATKGGQEVASSLFLECFIIEAVKETRNLVYGHLKINPDFTHEIDYEKYDTIFLTIRVCDINQEIGENSTTAVLTIRIDDLNDNPPQFAAGTLEEVRYVTEMGDIMNTIGTIEAFDIDGPGNNNITFALRPIGNLTNPGLISINETTGLLRVTGLIQCDVPKIYHLEYEVLITDSMHTVRGKFNISIIDINNQVPQLDIFEQQVSIYENSTTGQYVGHVKAFDNDRDSPHNSLEFSINSAFTDLHNIFQINITTGEVYVNLRNGFILDRDMGVTYHYIPIDIKDNYNFLNAVSGPVNQRSTFLNVTLLDVNDNAPKMPDSKQIIFEFSEADDKVKYLSYFIALDRDEENTRNSELVYTILSIKPVMDNNPNVSSYEDLFTMTTLDNRIGKLECQKSLKGFYGIWQLEIEASDNGLPKLKNISVYEVNVKPYNFHIPQIQYPIQHKSIRICYSLQEPLRPLYEADCSTRLRHFEVSDPDGGEYGDVHFEISSDVGHDQYFQLSKESRNSTNLYVKNVLPAGIYLINLRAIDGGGSTSAILKNLKIVFVDMLGNPMFLETSFITTFTENSTGLLEERYIPEARDPKNEGLDDTEELYRLYYFIDDTIYTENSELFQLNSTTRQLKLKTALDRELIDELQIRIKVTNNENGLITNPNSINYTLVVNIHVIDVNDNSPKFMQKLYAGGLTSKDSIGKSILMLKAEDPDLDDRITYTIDIDSYESHLKNVVKNVSDLISLDPETGELNLISYVPNNMEGYMMFNVTALDLLNHSDITSVKIFIVSESNRVKFVFLSDIQVIRRQEKLLRDQLQNLYDYDICNIDSIEDVTNARSQNARQSTNNSTGFITEVKAHFIHNNEAVDAYEIKKKSNDLAFISRLQNTLQTYNLILNDIPHLEAEKESPLVDNWLLTGLVGLCTTLGLIALSMTVLYVVKVRSLKRQLKAFEPAEFGSIASNLNRIAGPSANIFSVEGSNPIFQKQNNENIVPRGVYDNETSSDSDSDDDDEFEGLHNDPLFEMNNMKNIEQKTTPNFEHKILNNDFFTQDKLTNKETNASRRY